LVLTVPREHCGRAACGCRGRSGKTA
jgi:hypothetical protein